MRGRLLSLPQVQIGDDRITIRRPGSTRYHVARILGTESDPDGQITRIWLDRRIHQPGEEAFQGWEVRGAFVTELVRMGREDAGA